MTVKAFSGQLAKFEALMLASQDNINKGIADIKQEVSQINTELKGIKETADQAKK